MARFMVYCIVEKQASSHSSMNCAIKKKAHSKDAATIKSAKILRERLSFT